MLWLQLKTWYELVVGETQYVVKGENVVEEENVQIQSAPLFQVEVKEWLFMIFLGIYPKWAASEMVEAHFCYCRTEGATHFTKWLPAGKMLSPTDYSKAWGVVTSCQVLTKVVTNVPQTSVDVHTWKNDMSENSPKQILQTGHKSVSLMKDPLQKVSKLGN